MLSPPPDAFDAPAEIDEQPAWARKLAAAREAAWALLTPAEREEAETTLKASRDRRKERRRLNREQGRRINEMFVEGATPKEIGAAEGLKPHSLRYRFAGLFASRKGFRRLFGWVCDEHVAALDRAAVDLGMERRKALEFILSAVLEDDALVFRRVLKVRRAAA